MLVKFTHFLEMYIFLHVVIAVMSVAFASSALSASVMLMTELMIFDKHIYFCMF